MYPFLSTNLSNPHLVSASYVNQPCLYCFFVSRDMAKELRHCNRWTRHGPARYSDKYPYPANSYWLTAAKIKTT